MIHTFKLTDADGNPVELHLPVTMTVCSSCEGRGTRVNPAIDGNGLTGSDFHEDPDFREAYFAGHYDEPCPDCGGLRVTPIVDREKADPEALAFFDECEAAAREAARFNRESYLERMAERRFGC